MAFSNNLRYLRKKFNMSQEDLANKLGYKSFTTIQKWESGVSEPSVTVVKQLSKIFNVSMDDIVNTDLSKENSEAFFQKLNKLPGDNISKRILSYFYLLNPTGQEKVIEYMNDLLESDKYTNNEEK